MNFIMNIKININNYNIKTDMSFYHTNHINIRIGTNMLFNYLYEY